MNHGLETHVDLAAADDLGDILCLSVSTSFGSRQKSYSYTWVVWLQQCNLDALLSEVALGLSQIDWSMVWRGVPV